MLRAPKDFLWGFPQEKVEVTQSVEPAQSVGDFIDEAFDSIDRESYKRVTFKSSQLSLRLLRESLYKGDEKDIKYKIEGCLEALVERYEYWLHKDPEFEALRVVCKQMAEC